LNEARWWRAEEKREQVIVRVISFSYFKETSVLLEMWRNTGKQEMKESKGKLN
jgi:hypothetical protein